MCWLPVLTWAMPGPFPSIPPLPCRLASQISPCLLTAWQMLKGLLGGKSNFKHKTTFLPQGNRVSPCSAATAIKSLSLQWDSPAADIRLSRNPREAAGLGERSGHRGSNQPESSASHHCWAVSRHTSTPCPLASRSAPAVCQQLGKCLWSQNHCMKGYLVICNGFSTPVIISSPELKGTEDLLGDGLARRVLLKPVVLQFSSGKG